MVEETDPKARPAGRVQDARGRWTTFLDPYELNLLRRYDVIPADPLRPIAEQVGFGLPTWQRRGYFACVGMFGLCVAFLIIWKLVRGTGVDFLERILWPLNLAVFALGAVKFWQSGRRARAKRVVAVMLDYRRCPHCGYDLQLLPPDAKDGATVCPECGCAWMIEEASVERSKRQAEYAD
jgi:hypothetical protein